ncbi:MAG TPA: class I SAM-dependent methyltransferase [Aggregatilineales bacterium]|nr:class I SAM-dependent methyltransferase [Aggregatilineales bacterium]
MADHKALYAQASYYDIVFDRDVSHELNFAFASYRELNGGKEPPSLIDIACGPGYHALLAAQRGLRSIGLDLREEMVRLGSEKATSLGVTVEWLAEDMRTFKLTPSVAIALNMFDSFDVLQTDEDVIAHFRAMHENILPGGIYLIDLSHPRDTAYGIYGDFTYTGQRDGIKVKIEWNVHEGFDLVTGLSDVTTHLTAVHPDGRVERFESRANERMYLPRELNALVREAGGFKSIGWYGNFRKNQPLDFSSNAVRQIAIYQRV